MQHQQGSPAPLDGPDRRPAPQPEKKERCLMKMARCFKPLFKDRLIVTSSKCTIWCNFVLCSRA
jgi:hypothetical protein